MGLLEQFKDKTIYIITDADFDGVSSHIIAKLHLEPIVKTFLYTLTYDRSMSEFNIEFANKSEIIIFVDIAPTVELYKQLLNNKKEVYIFDHHITSYTELQSIVENNYFFTEEKCGAKIFFDEITKGQRKRKVEFQYIQLVDTYDRWQQQSLLWKNASKLQDIMYEYVNWYDDRLTDNDKYIPYIEVQIDKILNAKNFYFTVYEEKLAIQAENKRKKNLEAARKSLKIRKDNSGNKYGYFECNSKLSTIGNIILNEYSDLKYVIGHSTFLEVYKHIPNGKISLRSNDGFDVNLIAEVWSGGGHPQSSGADIPLKEFEKLKKGLIHLI